ncbi:hypothetical protein Tco_0918256, partial [Tanacetum coccineum]
KSSLLLLYTHEQQTSTIPTSVVRNTEGKNGPQNLEEPASNEALRELCDKNYHQLLPLIAEKMQKEKEQQDKLKAVKARLLYGDESGKNPRNHKKSRYSESKTPTARTEPRRRHCASTPEARHQSLVSSEDSNRTDLLHPGPGRGRREVCSIGWEEKNRTRLHVLIVTTIVPKQRELRHWQESIIMRAHRPEEPADILRAKIAKEVTGSPNQKGIGQILTRIISPDLGHVKKAILSRPGSDILISQGQGCLAMSRHMTEHLGKIIASKQNTLRIQWRYIISSKGTESQWRTSWKDTKKKSPDVEGVAVKECMVTTSFLQGEVAAFSHGRKKAPCPGEATRRGENNELHKGFF